jgi:NAD(P)-dependent dehydrogenase (short-subunit alcohol dehydrogenase family)
VGEVDDSFMRRLRELMALDGRVALITGGAGHIGSAMGEALAELGAAVVVVDLSDESCSRVAGTIEEKYGVRCLPLAIDLTSESEVKTVPDTVLKELGRLDIVVNCAALVGTSDLKGWTVPFTEQRTDTWRLAFEVNLTAPFVLVRTCAGALAESGHGSVINIGSHYGFVGPNMSIYEGTEMGNAAAYAASKGGLLQLTRWLATVLAPSVRVNAISPGGIWRDQPEVFRKRYVEQTPLGRMCTEEDLKGAVAYLASDLSAYVTGHHLIVDGGLTVW